MEIKNPIMWTPGHKTKGQDSNLIAPVFRAVGMLHLNALAFLYIFNYRKEEKVTSILNYFLKKE